MNQQQGTVGTSADLASKERSVKEELAAGKGKMAELAETATSAGKAQLDSGLTKAAGQVDHIAKALDDAAARLKDEHQDGLASYATQVATSITSLADRLRESSVDELASEARQLARANPAMFILGSIAVGFGLTRFLKASSRVSDLGAQTHAEATHAETQRDMFGSTYGDSRPGGASRDSRETVGGSSWTNEYGGGSHG